MPRLLPAIALIAAQLLSWGGAPLYLCLACDGSVRLDYGPDSCDCRHEQSADPSDSSHASHCVCGHHHDDELTARESRQQVGERHVNDPCGCLHIRILHSQQPRISSAHRLLPTDFAMGVTVDLVAFAGQAAIVTSTDSSGAIWAEPGALSALASVILRC